MDFIRSLVVSTNRIFFLLSGRTVCHWKYDSCGSLFVALPYSSLSDPSQILNNPYLGTFLIRKERSPYCSAPIYLVLRLPDTISPIPFPTPYPLSLVRLRQALQSDNHNSSSTDRLKHKLETRHPVLCFPVVVYQAHLLRSIPSRDPQSQVLFHEMSWTPWMDLPDPSSLDPIDRTYRTLTGHQRWNLEKSGVFGNDHHSSENYDA